MTKVYFAMILVFAILFTMMLIPIYAQEDGGYDSGDSWSSDSWDSGSSDYDSWGSSDDSWGSSSDDSWASDEWSGGSTRQDSWGDDSSDSWGTQDSWSNNDQLTNSYNDLDVQRDTTPTFDSSRYIYAPNGYQYPGYYGYGGWRQAQTDMWWNFAMFYLLFFNYNERVDQLAMHEIAMQNSTDIIYSSTNHRYHSLSGK